LEKIGATSRSKSGTETSAASALAGNIVAAITK
jgi:hypothetical protein